MNITVHSHDVITEPMPGKRKTLVKIPMNEFYTHEFTEVVNKAREKGKPIDIQINLKREKRSLNANAYAWALITKLAEKMRTSKDEMYIKMLKEYGQTSHQIFRNDVIDFLPKIIEVDYFEIMEPGNEYSSVLLIAGSSKYNSREMAILIDGIVSECKEQDIETLPPEEIERMKAEW